MKSPSHLPENTWNNAVEVSYKKDPNRTIVDHCIEKCVELDKYVMGIDSGTICKCGKTSPIKPRSNMDDFCEACSDDLNLSCGNVNYGFMSVYRIY